MHPVKIPKKLIETALPLDDINKAAVREKSIRHGHPSTLHLWWARRPLAAARAVLFAQMVNDPGYEREYNRGINKKEAEKERERLFGIIRRLVQWENINNEEVLEEAREEIRRSWRETCTLNKNHPQASELFNPDKLPDFHDPFAGGGALPLEAQRLGLNAFASDLNPVAVTINKAMIEIPPKFANRAPIGPLPQGEELPLDKPWRGAEGLAEDVRRYGLWMYEEAEKRIGRLYPKIEITKEMAEDRPDLLPYVGEKLTVIAWLWARTVKSPNPAFADVDVPLISNFILSSKKGKESYIQPEINGKEYRFIVKTGTPPKGAENGTKAQGRGANFYCLLSHSVINGDYIKQEGQAKRLGSRLMAIVAEGKKGRIYLAPNAEHEQIAHSAEPRWKPSGLVPARLTGGTCVPYGLKEWGDLFTPRQLLALNTFSDLVQEAIEKCCSDALNAGMLNDGKGLEAGGNGAKAYSEAVGVYLAFAVDKISMYSSSLSTWHVSRELVNNVFGRQAIPMVWDFAEGNIFSHSSGCFTNMLGWVTNSLVFFPTQQYGSAQQKDAQTQCISLNKLISSDPPYYDNIYYSEVSDFFYGWLRHCLQNIFQNLFATMSTPKEEELVASPYRHGGKEQAEQFFMNGMTQALSNLAKQCHPAFPVTIYYAFKQSEMDSENAVSNSGWETFLEAVLKAGFAITGTWPMRTELTTALKNKVNALASSIVLVCRKRSEQAPSIERREFLRELNQVMREAYQDMTRGGEHSPVVPVDLSQAIIGPGMAVFSKYHAVLEADGTPMSVKSALRLINASLDSDEDLDSDTQFCLAWYEEKAWNIGSFGDADVLARAKGSSIGRLSELGIAESGSGNVRLIPWSEYPADRKARDNASAWEALHRLIQLFQTKGEESAAIVLNSMNSGISGIRSLAYRLYTLCERKKRTDDARAYNEIIEAWSSIEQTMISLQKKQKTMEQGELS